MLNQQSEKIAHFYWFLGLAQVVHSIEETYTNLYDYFAVMSQALHNIIHWIPAFGISADWFAIFNYLMIALILGSVPSVEKGSGWSFYLMWIWAIVEFLNGIFHISMWFIKGGYFPGGISGPILFVLSILFIQQLITASNQETAQLSS
ncbi:MAG: HXXEE domain-containing protein [Cyanobacteria bacterium P01_D01_bin.50]